MLQRRERTLATLVLGATLLATSLPAPAQAPSYPARPIRMIVAADPGGGMDILSRLIGPKLTESWGQPVVIENKPGAGGNIGMDLVAKSPADGYTLTMVYMSLVAVNPSLYSKLPFDVIRDFTPVVFVASIATALVVHPSVPARSVQELIALAKAKPGQLNYSSAGAGTGPHLAGELLKSTAGVDIVGVPYNGSGPALLGLLSGQTSLMFNTMVQSTPHIQSGKLRALAVTSVKRSSAMPELPTMIEAGVPGFAMDGWFGVLAPAGVPRDIVNKINVEVRRILSLPDVRERLAKLGAEPSDVATPEQFGEYIKAELAKWSRVVKASGMKVE